MLQCKKDCVGDILHMNGLDLSISKHNRLDDRHRGKAADQACPSVGVGGQNQTGSQDCPVKLALLEGLICFSLCSEEFSV